MKVTMTVLEKMAIDYAKQFVDWDKRIIAKDTYLVAYKLGMENEAFGIPIECTKLIEVEFVDGEHQL